MKQVILVFSSLLLLSFALAPDTQKVVDHAKWQTTQQVTYDGSYRKISYPNGDVPANIGVCTDVIIRAYRSINQDLQKLMHEDIVANPNAYKIIKADRNIDHRRVPNMKCFLKRKGAELAISDPYLPGDIVFWNVAAGHVGIVIDVKVPGTNRYYIVHNIGAGPKMEDFLYSTTIVGHYRWWPTK
jgi:uncharacterized protein YijF (DUF1287 family)